MIDLHELINRPGYGAAEKELRKADKWNDELSLDGTKEYKVTVGVTGYYNPQTETQYYTVVASDADEAKDMAEELCDFDHIDDCFISKVTEAE